MQTYVPPRLTGMWLYGARLVNDARKLQADRVGKTDMRDDAVTKEGRDPRLCAIVKLIRQDDIERPVLLFERADGARGDDPLHTELFEAINVGAEVEFRGHDRVIAIMPRKKNDALPFKCADAVAIGRVSKRRLDFDLLNVRETFHLIKAAATDDANSDVTLHVPQAPVTLRALMQDE